MSSLSFQPIQNGTLYQSAENGTAQKVFVYWLLLSGNPPSGNLDSADTWKYSGCYIFSASAVTNVSGFIAAVGKTLVPVQANTRWAAWISNPDPAKLPGTMTAVNANLPTSGGSTIAQTVNPLSLPLANILLNVPGSANMTFNPAPSESPDTPALTFQSVPAQSVNIGLQRNTGIGAMMPGLNLAVPLSGASAGAALFDVTVDRGTFYYFFTDSQRYDPTPRTVEHRYFYGSAGSVQTMHYPFFPPVRKGNSPISLNASLDPLNVWDSSRTIFAFDQSMGANLPTSNFFSGTDGHPLTLVPQQNAGFAFGVRPPASGETSSGPYAYLTPAGVFGVTPVTETSHGLAGVDPTTIRHLMCGMTGTEYLIAEPGATVEFVTGNNAYAQGFTPPSGSLAAAPVIDPCNPGKGGQLVVPGGLMTGDYTTSWIQINPAESPAPGISYGYAVQPEAAVYYSTVNKPKSSIDAGTPYTYPLALGCRVSVLQEEAQSSELVPLPMASYGGVWLTGASPLPPTTSLQSFESQIIATTRHNTAPKDLVNGPTFFDPVTHLGVNGGFAKTPEGLLAQLNTGATAGTFQAIFLAQSPNKTPDPGFSMLGFNIDAQTGEPLPGLVNPILSNALMNDNLFMVVTNYNGGQTPTDPLGVFANEIEMDEWAFRLDVGYTTDQAATPKTILLFKFTTALNVIDLVANQAYWQEWQNFIDSDITKAQPMAQIIQAQLNEALCIANPNGESYGGVYFQDFWNKVTDPNWTGVLAINCGLDAGHLPPDLQDLLGGINGELRAHHFGITVNQVKGADSSQWKIDQSSLFALVHYEAAYTPLAPETFGFQVLRLNALFENSVLTHFDSRIAVTIPKLFGENVLLEASSVAGANVLEIEGVYQKHGDTGTVVFDTKTPQIFKFVTPTTTGVRAIQEMYVTDAALVPVSSITQNGTITVQSNLAMSGQLMFIPEVGAAGSGLDIFSYGSDPKTGLGFNTYNIAMTTTITNNVGHLKSIGPDLSSFMITPATSTYRTSSLVAALPLKLTGFIQSPSSAGWPVDFSGASDPPFEADYALNFQVSLGSLGALSAFADSLDVEMVLGWKIAGTDAADNEIWLLMVPPQSMQGQLGFGLEGVLDTTFNSVDLVSQKWPTENPTTNVYGIFFMGVQIQLLNNNLIPGTSNFVLFADPAQGNLSNIGWLMTYVKKS